MMVLTVQNESIGWAWDLGLLGDRRDLLGLWSIRVESCPLRITGWHDADDASHRVFDSSDRSLYEVSIPVLALRSRHCTCA